MCTIVDDCAQIAESGLKPPLESLHLDVPEYMIDNQSLGQDSAILESAIVRSEKSQNESSPNFSNFCPRFCPEFCWETATELQAL